MNRADCSVSNLSWIADPLVVVRNTNTKTASNRDDLPYVLVYHKTKSIRTSSKYESKERKTNQSLTQRVQPCRLQTITHPIPNDTRREPAKNSTAQTNITYYGIRDEFEGNEMGSGTGGHLRAKRTKP